MTNTARRFLVAAAHNVVVIREVTPDTNAHEFTREAAWAQALRIARPSKAAKDPRSTVARQVEFQDMNGMRTVVRTAAQVAADVQPVAKPKVEAEVEAPKAEVKPATRPASEKQVACVRKLIAQKLPDMPAEKQEEWVAKAAADAKKASTLISGLIDMEAPKTAPKAQAATVTVPEGRYALRNAEGVVKFYKVEHGKAGSKWEGRTFLKVQASDDLFPVKNPQERQRILGTIAADPAAASKLYGHELKKCGVCNRTLTDEASREAGIGPVCAANAGW
jgi:hypothetical protein